MRFYDNLLGHDLTDPNLNLNKHGHRCAEIADVNLHNYILYIGDNVALDFNSPVEKTYPYITSKSLSMDYYNLSIFNGGIDAVKYNLLAWYYTYPKPKFVVIGTEFLNSFLVCNNSLEDFKAADYNTETVAQIARVGETSGFFPARRILAEHLLLNMVSIPIYQINFENKSMLFNSSVINVPYSGDIFDHENISKSIAKQYRSIKTRIMP